ncbi:MAG: M15 family metallopeptidase [Bacillota bacterium]
MVKIVICLCLLISVGCDYDQPEPDSDPLVGDNLTEDKEDQEEVDPGFFPMEQDEDEPGEDNTDNDTAVDGVPDDEIQSSPGDESYQSEDYKVISDGDYLLALVTKETTLRSDYVPYDLQPVPAYMNPSYNMKLREEALEYLTALWDAADADGVTVSIRSAYRSYSTQKSLFQDYASRHGEEKANRFSARPGQSEHQLGTTVDFGGTAVDFTAAFAQTEQGEWLAENAYKYGFAMSYPQGKEHITGYIFEPWHYRYIGIDAAREWKESGKTLKEYLESKPQSYN